MRAVKGVRSQVLLRYKTFERMYAAVADLVGSRARAFAVEGFGFTTTTVELTH